MSKLAINGGEKVRTKLFPAYNTIGDEEKAAVNKVLDTGNLSQFLGCWNEDFYGGPEVRSLEKEWAEYFGVKHAIAVNSATSGLNCATGAVGIGPGDEMIVTPWTMTASATAALVWGGIPVFADVEEEYYCLDVDSIEKKITPRTKAIMAVDILGQPYDASRINALAKKHNIAVIEDTAQAPGAYLNGKPAGTLADIGVFSLNYHKHIHSGEGGIVVTNNDHLAERVQLIRNHAEAVVGPKEVKDLSNMVGQNYRMTEIEAAIARCQLKKLPSLLKARQENCDYLRQELLKIPAIHGKGPREGATHSYYALPFKFKAEVAGVSRNRFIEAVIAELSPHANRIPEGPLIGTGCVPPLYLLPIYQNKIAFGKEGFPFNLTHPDSNISYDKGICPVTERLEENELFVVEIIESHLKKEDLDDVVLAFNKVWEYRQEL